MANTSVHLPADLLADLDRLAAERGSSRNRLIVESCREMLKSRRSWPEGFFSAERLDEEEIEELREGARTFTASIVDARRSRQGTPL